MNIQSAFFTVAYGVRQGFVLAPFLFAGYLDNLCEMCGFDRGRFIIVYADDILLLSPSVIDLEKLVHLCERELIWIDMTINNVKSLAVYESDRVAMLNVPILLLYLVMSCHGLKRSDIWEFSSYNQDH